MAEILQGDSASIGMFAVIQLAEGEAVSGRLVLPKGEVTLHLGQVVDARFGDVRGVDALYELLLWRGGRFVLDAGPVAAAPPIGNSAALLLEGCRLLDEWQRLEGMVLALEPGLPTPPALAPLLPHLDGRRRVHEVVAKANLLRCRVVDPLLDGLENALLVERTAPPAGVSGTPSAAASPAPASTGGDDDFDSLMETGRRHVRAGRHAEALVAFRNAVALRPEDRIATQNLRRIAALNPS